MRVFAIKDYDDEVVALFSVVRTQTGSSPGGVPGLDSEEGRLPAAAVGLPKQAVCVFPFIDVARVHFGSDFVVLRVYNVEEGRVCAQRDFRQVRNIQCRRVVVVMVHSMSDAKMAAL